MSDGCIFCSIAAGTAPAFVVWESNEYMAFLTPFPNTEGFTVVIPKAHHESYIFDAPDDVIEGIMQAAKHVALKIDATKGPALKLNKLQVPFFAAVTGPTGAVLAKKMYQTTFSFDGELTATEELAVVFNLTPTQAATATIYVGLGIDPADLQVGQ